MHKEGSEGEKRKCYLSKKMKRGDYEGEKKRSQGEGWVDSVLYPQGERKQPPLLAGSELYCYLNLAICIALFIHRCARVDNQSNLPPQRDRAL